MFKNLTPFLSARIIKHGGMKNIKNSLYLSNSNKTLFLSQFAKRNINFNQFSKNLKNNNNLKNNANSKKSHVSFKKVFGLVRQNLKILFVATMGLFVSTSVAMAIPASFGYIIDSIGDKNSKGIFSFVPAVVVVLLLGGMGSFLRGYYFAKASESIIKNLRQKLFSSLIRKDMSFFDNVKIGELVSRLNSDIQIMGKSFAGENLSFGMRHITQLFGSFAIMLYLSPKLTAVISLILPISYVSSKFYGNFVKVLSEKIQNQLSYSSSVAEESFSNIRTVRTFNKEISEYNKYKNAVTAVFNSSIRYAKFSSLFFSSTSFIGNLGMLSILFFGSYLVEIGDISVGTLTSFLFYAIYVGYSGINIASFFSEIMKGVGASKRIFELTDNTNFEFIKEKYNFKGKIEFKDVCFKYGNRPEDIILNKVNFTAKPGQMLIIVGPSGVGKSTILSLILRFYQPLKGSIKIDNIDISEINSHQLRNQIGVVSQQIELFSGSILQNIVYGKDSDFFNDIDYDNIPQEIITAAKKANAHDFIIALPDGYKTTIGNKGMTLSGGEKQRIAFARAILKNPQIFLFDEVTSSLDSKNEEAIIASISAIKDKTVILITHNMNIINAADCVLMLKDGKVTKIGSPSEFCSTDFVGRVKTENEAKREN